YATQSGTSTISTPQAVTSARTPKRPTSVPSSLQKQWQIAVQPAVKIAINKTGWYHVSMSELTAAGLSANPNALRMFVGGAEIPIKITTECVEFYGPDIDTATSSNQIQRHNWEF